MPPENEYYVIGRWPRGDDCGAFAYWYMMRFRDGVEVSRIEGFLDGTIRILDSDNPELSEGTYQTPSDLADEASREFLRVIAAEVFEATHSAAPEAVDWESVWTAGEPLRTV